MDIVIPLAHLGELRLYRDKKQQGKVWLMFKWPAPPGFHFSSVSLSDDDIPRLVAAIDEAVKTDEPHSYRTYTDHLVEFHPNIHPDDKKGEGRIAGRLWMGFHNLTRVGHETREARRACMSQDETIKLVAALREITL